MAQPKLIHRRDADPATLPGATAWAVAALQRAMLAVVGDHEARTPGAVAALLLAGSGPASEAAWSESLERVLTGLPTPAAPSALVLAAQARNPALVAHADVLGTPELAPALDALLVRSLAAPAGPAGGPSLGTTLLAPGRAHPDDLMAQVAFVLEHWQAVLPADIAVSLQRAQDVHREHTTFRGGPGFGPPPVEVADFGHGGPPPGPEGLAADDEEVRFSRDHAWMQRLVMMAKHTHVWLDQLSRRFHKEIRTLDAIPDDALADLAEAGVNGLWLIGVWERSEASRTIKHRMGNPEALASAYSVWDYVVADALGGEPALEALKARAARYGIRIGADMVPNHTAIDGRWVAEHPERFVQVPAPPFPNYTFDGDDLSRDGRMQVQLEDGYWTKSDAAVVFRHQETSTGRIRYIYHGNDGTVMPWNDTAQLDFTRAETREAVIQTLVAVAQRFPILRLDAAMTLARRHVQRLWYPPPGQGGAIPSRAAHGRTQAEFEALMPREFWVEVVERVAAEAPDTLLLAEAFWMMEEYFVRSLGMHRVYHSAFMHMLRDGDNAGFRRILRDMLAYSPAVLARYANFLSNPDEETAAEQFGTMDRYFTAATLQATLPGLPMLGHGQLEGSREKYGMEAARAREHEVVDAALLGHHEAVIFPLLRERERFASTEQFHLFDHIAPDGSINEDVYAFCNRAPDGRRSLVLVNHGGQMAKGRLHTSSPRNEGSIEAPHLVTRSLADALGLRGDDGVFYAVPEQRSGQWRLVRGADLHDHGFAFDLGPHETRVFTAFEERVDHDGQLAELHRALGGRPVDHLDTPERPDTGLPVRPVDPSLAAPGGLAPALPPRGAGILLHPSSLPGAEGIGTIGQSARDLVGWLARAGLRYWQVLPLCEGGPGDSPYSSPASLVGNPWLIDLMDLHNDGLITGEELVAGMDPADGDVDFCAVRARKGPVLRAAARRLLESPHHPLFEGWLAWRDAHPWMPEAALFGELREAHGGKPWWQWDEKLRDRDPDTLATARHIHGKGMEERAVLAFLFDHQWAHLRAVADAAGVLVVGDLPIYVSRDSADAWVDRELFEFDENGQPARVAGVPPDDFSATGQLWGNPLYDWQRMAADDYAWWVRRLQRCLTWTPVLRIDHFRGFAAYWAVPATAETALAGQWVQGPGLALFQALREALGGQWLLAEDLGEIDAPVHLLREQAGLLCTRVLQFGFGGDPNNLHLPGNVPPDAVMYTGTHDNDTTAGWWAQAQKHERAHVHEVLGDEVDVGTLVQAALGSAARMVVLPMQDALGLGTEARMNVPGVGEGNWAWRMAPGMLGGREAAQVHAWVAQSGRLPE
jgi:4-alpha-glucanotransferase